MRDAARRVLAAGLILALAGCAAVGGPKPKNVVLVSIDTLRADHVGCYNGSKMTATPNIDALAARGVRFERAYSSVPVTTPSHASLFTGTQPPFHGVRSNGSFVLPKDRTTIAELFQRAGFDTAGFVGAFPLDRQFGLDQGFATYDDAIERSQASMTPYDAERRAETVVKKAVSWLDTRAKEKPFFLFMHFYDPHHPYDPPEPWRSKHADDLYTGEIDYADEQLGKLLIALEAQKVLDDTLVVVLSDHGESLGEHGESTHMIFVYDATLRVPLIAAGPGLPKGKVVTDAVRLVDVNPTLAALAGIESSPEAQGRSLANLALKDEKPTAEAMYYSESLLPQIQFGWAPLESIRDGKYKYIHAPRPELYDLEADPKELNNLWGKDEERDHQMQRLLKKARSQFESPEAEKAVQGEMSAAAAEKLRSLGYLVGSKSSATSAVDPMSLPDPKDKIEIFNATEEALRLASIGKPDEAVAIYRRLLAEAPEEKWVVLNLARSLMGMGRAKETLDFLTPETLSRLDGGEQGSAQLIRVGALEELGRYQEALSVWNQIERQSPELADQAAKGRANALVELGRAAEALPLLEPLVAKSAQDGTLQRLLGRARLDAGQLEAGVAALARANELEKVPKDVKHDPRLEAARYLLSRKQKDLAADVLRPLAASAGDPASKEAAYLLSTLDPTAGDESSQLLARSRESAAKGDFRAAAKDLLAAIAGGQDTAATRYDLAVCYLNLGAFDSAHNELVRSLEKDPDFVPALADYGYVAEKRGDVAGAEKHYVRALTLSPGFPPALTRLGIFYSRRGLHDRAIPLLQRAVQAQPEDASAQYNLGIALKNAGRTAEAERAFAESRRLEAVTRR